MISLVQKNKNAKNMRKAILQPYYSCFVQKTALKNTRCSRNETILKIGHLAKAIACAKWSVWIKKLKLAKTFKNDSTTTLGLFCAKKTAGING